MATLVARRRSVASFLGCANFEGHRDACLLQRTTGDRVEFLVLTCWRSMHDVRGFAGDEPSQAMVEPEARAVLREFDETVDHYEVVLGPTG